MTLESLTHRVSMPLTRLLAILIVAATVGLPAAHAGQDQAIITSITADQLKTILKEEGYAVSTDQDGDLLWKIEGYRTYLIVSDKGQYVQFQSSFEETEATIEKVNEWNKTKRYSRSYLDDDQDPILELDLDLEGGITRARINSFLKTCAVSFKGWLKEVVD